MERTASPLTCIALVAEAEATLSNGLSAQVAFAIADRSTVRVPPTGRYMTFTSSGFVETTCHMMAGSFGETATDTFESQLGSAMSVRSTPRASVSPSLWTVIVKSTGVAWFAGTIVGATVFVTRRFVSGRKGQLR